MAHIWNGAAGGPESQHERKRISYANTDVKGSRRGGQSHTMQFLTCPTVTILRIQRLLPAQLILDLSAVATRSVPDLEIGIVVVHLVRRTVFPLIELAMHIGIVAIVTIGAVCRSVRA